jgi:hypothetical protein
MGGNLCSIMVKHPHTAQARHVDLIQPEIPAIARVESRGFPFTVVIGRPGVPFLPNPQPIRKLDLLTSRLPDLHERATQDNLAAPTVAIPEEQIQGSDLLVLSKSYELWPTMKVGRKIVCRLAPRGQQISRAACLQGEHKPA